VHQLEECCWGGAQESPSCVESSSSYGPRPHQRHHSTHREPVRRRASVRCGCHWHGENNAVHSVAPSFLPHLPAHSLTHSRTQNTRILKKHSPSQAPTPATRSPAHPAAHSFPLARIVLHRVAPRVCIHVRNHALTHNLGMALCCRAEPAPCTK
jgi:hypothetical protein